MILKIVSTRCSGCGRCVACCPFHALSLVTERADGFGRKVATLTRQKCNGCGNCIAACPHSALQLMQRKPPEA